MLLVIPVYQTFWILSGTLSGLIYFDEIQEIANDSTKATMFFIGTAMALGALPSMIRTRALRTRMQFSAAMFHLFTAFAVLCRHRDHRWHLRAHAGARRSRIETVGDEPSNK